MKTDAQHVDEENIQLLFGRQFKQLQQLSLLSSLNVSAYIPADRRCHMAADDASYQWIWSTDVSDVRSVQRHHRLHIKALHSFK